MRSEEIKPEDAEPRQTGAAGSPQPSPHSSLLTPHCIRLGPPWHIITTESGTRHARKFGRPRTLDPDERLWVVCAHLSPPAEVYLNGERVGNADTSGPFAADVTSLLAPRNEVVFVVPAGGELGAVALEVRRA